MEKLFCPELSGSKIKMVTTAEQFLAWGAALGRIRKVSLTVGRKGEPLRGVRGMRVNTSKIAYIETAVVTKMLQHNLHPLEVKNTGFLLNHGRFLAIHVITHNQSVLGLYFGRKCGFEAQWSLHILYEL